MAEDNREALDALQADMAAHQRQHVGEVTAEKNRILIAPELEKLEKAWADQPSPAPAPPPAPVERSLERRDRGGREYLLSKMPDTAPSLVRVPTDHEAWFLSHAMPRVELLLSLAESGPLGQASWRDRLLAVMQIKSKAAAWRAAAAAPDQLAHSRRTLEKDQALLKVLGLETISQLTPAFCTAKAAELERQHLEELCEILDASDLLGFGPWKGDRDPRIQV